MTDAAPDTGEQTTDTEAPEQAEQTSPDTGEKDWAAEAEKWKAQARKHEERAKSNAAAAKELEKVRQESMTEQERAVAEAKNAARAEVLREVGTQRVDDAVRLAAAGRSVDVDALLDGLDRSRFLTEEFAPDTEAITGWVDRIAPQKSEESETFPDLGQGARGSSALPLNGDPLLRDLKSKLGIR